MIDINPMLRVGIYYINVNWAKQIFDYIIKELQSCDIDIVKTISCRDHMQICTQDVTYDFIYVNENTKGHSFDRAYIQNGAKQYIINNNIDIDIFMNKVMILYE